MNEAGTPINPIALQLGPLSVHWYSGVGKRIAGVYLNSGNRIEENLLRGYGPP